MRNPADGAAKGEQAEGGAAWQPKRAPKRDEREVEHRRAPCQPLLGRGDSESVRRGVAKPGQDRGGARIAVRIEWMAEAGRVLAHREALPQDRVGVAAADSVEKCLNGNSGIGYVLQRSIGTFDLPTMFAALVDPGPARRRPVLDRRPNRTPCDSLARQPASGHCCRRVAVNEKKRPAKGRGQQEREDDMVRLIAALAAALIWTALAVAPAKAADKVVLMLNWYVYGEHAPFFYGKAKGIYAAENIDLEIQEGRGSAATTQAVAAKTADFGYVDVPTMMRAAIKGAP